MINFSYIVLFHDNNSTDCVIDSILSQSILGDEIIVVNDHSKKENLNIFHRFSDSITIVHSDRKGNRGYNRNYGAKYAKNEYLLFVDGDILFLPNTILAMRTSMERGYIGAVGNIICGDKTIPQMNLITGTDYLNLIRTELSVENIIKLGLLYDKRQQHIYDKIALNSVWEYFYSGYCAIKKDVFDDIGGFETEFVGWGVEDDELGYRLHLKGALEYNNSAYAVHAPHMRNLYKCLTSNRINLYRFLAKFPSNEIGIHMIFGNWTERSLSYLCRSFDQLYQGETYASAKPAIHIGFLNFHPFPEYPEFYATYKLINEKNGMVYSDKFSLSVIDLKHIELSTDEDKESLIDKWAKFFIATSWEEVIMIAEHIPHLEAAAQTLCEANADEATKRKCRARRDYYKQVNTTEKLLLELRAEKDSLNAEISSLEDALAQRQSSLAEKEVALAEKDSALAEKDSALAEKDSQIANLTEYIKQLEQQLNN